MLLPSSQLFGGPEGYSSKVISFLKEKSTNILFWYFFFEKSLCILFQTHIMIIHEVNFKWRKGPLVKLAQCERARDGVIYSSDI